MKKTDCSGFSFLSLSPSFQNNSIDYYLSWLRLMALRFSLRWECTRSLVANALINESSPANTVEQIRRASWHALSPGVCLDVPSTPSIFKHACWPASFVPPPIVPTSTEYIVQAIYRSRFSGPAVSIHVKPKHTPWVIDRCSNSSYEILTITAGDDLSGILTTGDEHGLENHASNRWFEVREGIRSLTATIFAAWALNPPMDPAMIEPRRFLDWLSSTSRSAVVFKTFSRISWERIASATTDLPRPSIQFNAEGFLSASE